MRLLFTYIILLVSLPSVAQSGLERQVNNRIEKGKWKSAVELVQKSLRKDSINPEADVVYSKLFLNPRNPSQQIDSAHRYATKAIDDFEKLPAHDKDRLRRIPLDSFLLVIQKKKVDSAAFDRAKRLNTEASYNDFLGSFAGADEIPAATELRNEVAFVDALKVNSHAAFEDYLMKYPASARAPEARNRYEKLLFEDKTREGTLSAFEKFYRDYPASPYRLAAAKIIFEISTAGGRPEAFRSFITAYPSTPQCRLAEGILYHLLREDDASVAALGDSLRKVHQAGQDYWIPTYRSGKYGFMDAKGRETLPPSFESIPPEYLCGNIKDDYLITRDGIISRDGHWIVKEPVGEVTDLGLGFLKITSGSCTRVVHKSGTQAVDCVEDAKTVGRNFIAVRQNGKWGLRTLTGRKLLDSKFDDFMAVDDLIIMVQAGKKSIVTIETLASLLNKGSLTADRVFDEIQRLAAGTYLVKNGSLEGVLDGSLSFIVPLDRQSIAKAPRGFILRRGSKYYVSGVSDKFLNRPFNEVLFYGEWVRLRDDNDIELFAWATGERIADLLDTLWFENKIAFAKRNDSLRVYLPSGTSFDFPAAEQVAFVRSQDSTRHFYIREKRKNTVFDCESGARLFSLEFDELEYLGQGIFLVVSDGKKGLCSSSGKPILPTEYDAIVPAGPDMVSLLKERKFGLYNFKSKKLLKPAYERNVVPAGEQWLVAFREGTCGFIGWDGKASGLSGFEEVLPWNDTSVLVRQNYQWMIYGLRLRQILMKGIKDYRVISSAPGETLAIVHQGVQYGVISNKRGEVIPANFSDVINLGSDDEPLFFAEKNVEETGIYVVLYYDKNGKLVRKQVYEASEYEKIYCNEK